MHKYSARNEHYANIFDTSLKDVFLSQKPTGYNSSGYSYFSVVDLRHFIGPLFPRRFDFKAFIQRIIYSILTWKYELRNCNDICGIKHDLSCLKHYFLDSDYFRCLTR